MNNRQHAVSKIVALYERLSQEDESTGDSNSIRNQKAMLADCAAKNGFINPVHFTDDGYSGGSFDRPGCKKLINEIEAGNVETVICKDIEPYRARLPAGGLLHRGSLSGEGRALHRHCQQHR